MGTEILRLSYTLNTIDVAVKQFWETAGSYHVFAFSGDMGAGKTTFIHHLCEYLQVQDAVSSPTFALINEYRFTDTNDQDSIIYHMDWYRLRDSQEAFNAGMEDCVDQAMVAKAFCFIEWPEKAKELLARPYVWLSITSNSDTDREMVVSVIK